MNTERFWMHVDRAGGPNACWPWTLGRTPFGYGRVRYAGRTRQAHLFLGSNADNAADRDAKGRQATGDRSGSRLYPERLPRGGRHWTRQRPERLARGDRNGSRLHPERLAPPRGSAHGMSRLDEARVREIRALVAAGRVQREVAAMFGLTQSHVSAIARREYWGHL